LAIIKEHQLTESTRGLAAALATQATQYHC